MMIQQVSDSRKVAKVAGALGLLPPPTANPAQPANSTQSTQDPTQLPSVAESDASRPLNQAQIIESLGLVSSDAKIQRWSEILAILMKDLSSQDKATLAGKIFDIADQPKKSAQPQSLPDDSESILANQVASWQKILLRWIDLSDSQNPEHRWIEELQVALESWPNPQSPETIQRSLRLALDRSVLGDLTDNTPWKTTERVSLARLLVRATQLAGHFQDALYIEAVPSISIPQLLSQTDTLRGRCYRIRGTIGLIEPTSSIELANARKLNYSVLWLRPDDLSDQPINIYIPQGGSSPNAARMHPSVVARSLQCSSQHALRSIRPPTLQSPRCKRTPFAWLKVLHWLKSFLIGENNRLGLRQWTDKLPWI
jgi:hypothetical protein